MFPPGRPRLDYLHQDLRHHGHQDPLYSRPCLLWWCNASGSLIDSVACNRFACPIDCKVSGNADAAAADNGAADKTNKTRSVIALTAHGDLAAPALTQIKPCNRFCCPVNGNVPSWEASAGLLAPRPAAPWAPRLAMPLYSYPRLMCGGAKTQAPAPSQPP